ncbi:MAG: efflux RND transporter periplasmic adaptor subunit [Bacteroidota bacterium]
MRFFNISATAIIIIFLIGGCTSPINQEEQSKTDNVIEISNEQFKAEDMKLGIPALHEFSQVIKTNGTITAPPQSKAFVYSYISGIIKSVPVMLGSHISKNEVLCTIQSKEFIQLQQEYLESIAKLKAVNSNYQRTKSLYEENISSQKNFFEIESEYKMLVAKIKALKAELKILNVNIKSLEDGKLSTYLPILSPIDGYITSQNCNIGQYVDSQKILMKITDNSTLQIYFYVYQDAVSRLKTGQSILLFSTENPNIKYNAKIISIGKSINPETKSILCIADIENTDSQVFLAGMYFQVDIVIDNMEAYALPSESIIKSDNKSYVLMMEEKDDSNIFFKKKIVVTGIESNGITQIIEGVKLSDKVLIKGTYYYQNE